VRYSTSVPHGIQDAVRYAIRYAVTMNLSSFIHFKFRTSERHSVEFARAAKFARRAMVSEREMLVILRVENERIFELWGHP
jgi:thymidylate synthase ThyX